MSTRFTFTVADDVAVAITRLAILEQRSDSQMIAILIEKRVGELRQEWAKNQSLPSLPQPALRRRRRKIDIEFEEKFGS